MRSRYLTCLTFQLRLNQKRINIQTHVRNLEKVTCQELVFTFSVTAKPSRELQHTHLTNTVEAARVTFTQSWSLSICPPFQR